MERSIFLQISPTSKQTYKKHRNIIKAKEIKYFLSLVMESKASESKQNGVDRCGQIAIFCVKALMLFCVGIQGTLDFK